MRSQQFLQGGISVSYEYTKTIVMKKIKYKGRNEKRKDSIKKIF